jgi:hypothetical protein
MDGGKEAAEQQERSPEGGATSGFSAGMSGRRALPEADQPQIVLSTQR